MNCRMDSMIILKELTVQELKSMPLQRVQLFFQRFPC